MGSYIYGTILSKHKYNSYICVYVNVNVYAYTFTYFIYKIHTCSYDCACNNLHQQYALCGLNGDPTTYNFHTL